MILLVIPCATVVVVTYCVTSPCIDFFGGILYFSVHVPVNTYYIFRMSLVTLLSCVSVYYSVQFGRLKKDVDASILVYTMMDIFYLPHTITLHPTRAQIDISI